MIVLNGRGVGSWALLGIRTASVHTLVRRLRFSMVVVLTKINCIEDIVMPIVKRPKRPPLAQH